jgi:hypothetical protein
LSNLDLSKRKRELCHAEPRAFSPCPLELNSTSFPPIGPANWHSGAPTLQGAGVGAGALVASTSCVQSSSQVHVRTGGFFFLVDWPVLSTLQINSTVHILGIASSGQGPCNVDAKFLFGRPSSLSSSVSYYPLNKPPFLSPSSPPQPGAEVRQLARGLKSSIVGLLSPLSVFLTLSFRPRSSIEPSKPRPESALLVVIENWLVSLGRALDQRPGYQVRRGNRLHNDPTEAPGFFRTTAICARE